MIYKIVVFDNTEESIEETFYTDEELPDIIAAIVDNIATYDTLEELNEANEE